MQRLQAVLDKINEKVGGIGAVIGVLFWMAVLFLAIEHMMLDL